MRANVIRRRNLRLTNLFPFRHHQPNNHQQSREREILSKAEYFSNIAIELNNVASEFYMKGDYCSAVGFYEGATEAMMTAVQPKQFKEQLSYDELRQEFVAQIVQGKKILHDMIPPKPTIPTNCWESFQLDSDFDPNPIYFSEAFKANRMSPANFLGDTSKCYSAIILFNNGLIHLKKDEIDLAEQIFDLALSLEETPENTPAGSVHALVVMALLNNIGYVQYKRGRMDKSFENFFQASQLGRKLLSQPCENVQLTDKREILKVPEFVGTIFYNIGMMNVCIGYHDRATEAFKDFLSLQNKVLGQNHASLVDTTHNIGLAYLEMGKADDAIEVFSESLQVRRQLFGDVHPSVAKSLYQLGQIYEMKGKHDGALNAFNDILSMVRMDLGVNHSVVAIILCKTGEIYYSRGELNKALKSYEIALKVVSATGDNKHPSDDFILSRIRNVQLEIENENAEAVTIQPKSQKQAGTANLKESKHSLLSDKSDFGQATDSYTSASLAA